MRWPLVATFSVALVGCASPPGGSPPIAAKPDAATIDLPAADVPLAVDVPTAADVPASRDAPPALDLPPALDAPPARLRVLFVGNSYTYVNDLPALMARMGDAASRAARGPALVVDSVTVGGATLRNHWETGTAPARIMAGGWDAVVLQGQSVEPALNPAEYRAYGTRFATLATEHGARPVFFATWPRVAGDPVYAQPWSGQTPAGFNARMNAVVGALALATAGTLAPVGDAWLASLAARPALTLYDPDGSHPANAGTWLAACVIYRALTGQAAPPETLSAVTNVPAPDAAFLRALTASP